MTRSRFVPPPFRMKTHKNSFYRLSDIELSKQDGIRSTGISIWSSDYEAANGQAIVTRQVVNSQTRVTWRKAIYVAGSGGGAVASVLVAAIRLWVAIMTRRSTSAYVVCSRSTGGFIRDLPALILAQIGIRTIVHVHGSDIVDLLTRRRLSRLARWLYRPCVLVVPSGHLVEALDGLRFHSVHLCENFLPASGSASTLSQLQSDEGLLVVWNSNILASKGFFALAEGLRKTVCFKVPIRLVAMGAPMADAEMSLAEAEARLTDLRNEPWFKYLGPVSPEVAAATVANADLVALPSSYASECQPLAIIQAMCLGKQILIADTPALRATVGDYPSLVLDDSSPETIARALMIAVEERKRDAQARQQAALAAQDRFSVERFDRRMEEILLDLEKTSPLAAREGR